MAFTAAPLPSLGLVIDTGKSDPGLFSMGRSNNQSLYSTNLLVGRKISGEYAEFALSGQDATLTESTPTAVTAAPLPSLSFFTLGATTAPVLIAETGYYSLIGRAATTTKSRKLVADPGAFGAEVAPAQRDTELNGDAATYYVLGVGASLLTTRNTTGAYGEFALTGFESFGRIETTGAKTLPGGMGRFSMSRTDNTSIAATTLARGRAFVCEPASFVVNGQSVTMIGPRWRDVNGSSGSWVYVTPSGGTWTDVDPDS